MARNQRDAAEYHADRITSMLGYDAQGRAWSHIVKRHTVLSFGFYSLSAYSLESRCGDDLIGV